MRGVRLLLYPFLIILFGGCQSVPTPNDSTGVERRYAPERDFARISEYFTGKENPGDRLYLRSQPMARGGYYWIIPVPTEWRGRPARVSLEVQIPGSPETREETFRIENLDKATLWTGMTGSDWPSPETRPVAWRLVVSNPEGETVLDKQSFLWSSVNPPGTDETGEP